MKGEGIGAALIISESIARIAHCGQKEPYTGDDYTRHVERVVALVEGDAAKAVAWLHDVLEDTEFGEAHLYAAGISQRIIQAVLLLTRQRGESYSEFYIPQIRESGDELAIAVKIADLKDHLRPNCPERLRSRYVWALTKLEGACR